MKLKLLRLLLAFALIVEFRQAHAQLLFSYGGAVGTLNNRDMRKFFDSYTRLVGNNMVKDNLRLGLAYGYSYSIDANFGSDGAGIWIQMRRSCMKSFASAEATDGTRHFEVRQNNWSMPFGLAWYDEQGLFVTGAISFGYSGNYLLSSFEYPDGTTSMGTERWLNGVFRSYSMSFAPMASAGFRPIRPLPMLVYGELAYFMPLMSSVFRERIYIDSNNYNLSDDKTYDTLPKDYEAFWADPDAYDTIDSKNQVRSGMFGWQLVIGLKLIL